MGCCVCIRTRARARVRACRRAGGWAGVCQTCAAVVWLLLLAAPLCTRWQLELVHTAPTPIPCRYTAELLITLIQRTAADLMAAGLAGAAAQPGGQAGGPGGPGSCPPQAPLPPPMLPGNYAREAPACLIFVSWPLASRRGRATPRRAIDVTAVVLSGTRSLTMLLALCHVCAASTTVSGLPCDCGHAPPPLLQEALEASLVATDGFEWVNERPEATRRGQQK